MDQLYTIIEVASKLNLSDKTLRRWEEAGRFTPKRTLGNQRRYTIEDLQVLDAIKHGTINEQNDLLTTDQAAKLCGVSPTTLIRWEESGKIHPFITSGNTYYPRQRLMEKMDELKKIYVEPDVVVVPAPNGSDLEGSAQTADSKAGRSDPIGVSSIQYSIFNVLITLLLIFTYHLIFNQPSPPISPQIQGASISTQDPRLDDLITKFNDHLSSEMLKNAQPIPTTTINLAGTSLITGTSTLPQGKDQISLPAKNITPQTPVTVTFTSDFAPAKKYWVTPADGSFTLTTDFPVAAESSFNYSFLATESPAIIKP